MRSLLLGVLIMQIVIPGISGQQWIVPADKKSKLSSFPFTDDTRNAGGKLYSVNCMSCHGTPGKANYLNLVPPPGDPATEKIQINNDGELFYKVATGRGQMPSFKSVLTSNEMWNIISYIRSFNNKYKQQVMPVITSSAYPGYLIDLLLLYNPSDKTITLKASASKDNSSVPVTGAEVNIFVHRTFGVMPVDESKTTDGNGITTFKVPDNLSGDKSGMVNISARFTNEELFGSVSKDTMLSAGNKTIPVSLTAQRAMWNNVRRAPVWIILTFSICLFAGWSVIFVVLMMLRDIFIIGETISKGLPIDDKP
jgi:hypothetical protein